MQSITIGQKNQWQKLFIQFLRIMGQVFEYAEDIKLMKLLNETFTNAEYWQGLINVFLMQLLESVYYEEQDALLSANELLIREKFKDKANDNVFNIVSVLEYNVALLHMLQKVIKKEKLYEKIAEDDQERLYWKKSIRKVLQKFICLLKPPESIIARFVSTAPAFNPITKCVLSFLAHYFSFGPKFNSQFNDEWLLFYIRTNYLSFIRIYNKGMRVKNTNERENSAEFCKCYIMCLLAMARNRSENTSRNFYKLRCVEFLTGEIDFEYNASIGDKKANTKEECEANEKSIGKIKKENMELKLDLGKLIEDNVPLMKVDGNESNKELSDNEEEQVQQKVVKNKVEMNLIELANQKDEGQQKVPKLKLPMFKAQDSDEERPKAEVKNKFKLDFSNLDYKQEEETDAIVRFQKPEEFRIEYNEELERKLAEIEDSDEELLQEYYAQNKQSKPDIKDKLKLDFTKLGKEEYESTDQLEGQKNVVNENLEDKLKLNLHKPNKISEETLDLPVKKISKEEIRDRLKFNKSKFSTLAPDRFVSGFKSEMPIKMSNEESLHQNSEYEKTIPQKTITLPSRIGRKKVIKSPIKRRTLKSTKNPTKEDEDDTQSRNAAPKFSINIHKSQANSIVQGNKDTRYKLKMISKRQGDSKKGLDSILNYSHIEGISQGEKEELNKTVIDKPRTVYKIKKDNKILSSNVGGKMKKPLAPPKSKFNLIND